MSTPRLRHPGRWLWIFLLIPVVIGFSRLSLDVEVLNLLPPDLGPVQGLKLYQRHFSDARELLITIKGKDPAEVEAEAAVIADRLRQRTDLVASAYWQAPWIEDPGASAELLAYLWLNQPPLVFSGLATRLRSEDLGAVLAETREHLATSMSPDRIARGSYDPFGLTDLPGEARREAPAFGADRDFFSSEDGTFRVVLVRANRELESYKACEAWVENIRQAIGKSPLKVGLTGRPAFAAEIGGGMESEMTLAVAATSLIIAALFWAAHRRWKPLLWLLALLGIILGCTLALGGLIYGPINVVSMGFAAILLGLAVDYAVVHYQEAVVHPRMTVPEIRAAIAPSILWAATTTIVAFLMLNFGGLPGLGQLGTLVGVGVTLAALIMVFEYLPPLFPDRREFGQRLSLELPPFENSTPRRPVQTPPRLRGSSPLAAMLVSGIILAGSLVVLLSGLPGMDASADPLRPRKSEAYTALAEMQRELNADREPLWLVVQGRSEMDVAQKLERVRPALEAAQSKGWIQSFSLPDAIWPNPENQAANRGIARDLAARADELQRAARQAGFSTTALGLTDRILKTWLLAAEQRGVFRPTNTVSRWVLDKISARSGDDLLAAGLIQPTAGPPERHSRIANLQFEGANGVWLSGWELLGESIFARVKANLWKVTAPMVVLVFLSLVLAFRKASEVLLSLGVLAFSGLALLAVMRLAGWSWNLLNLMAIPLILGTGVDYGIFMQQALRRHHGDLRLAWQSVGRALLLCGATAIAGFGSLAFSTNAGMGSLGKVCAAGIALNMVVSVFLLPYWWTLAARRAEFRAGGTAVRAPSSLYRAGTWRLGLRAVRILPRAVCVWLARLGADAYWLAAPHRREIVCENLAPALHQDAERSTAAARRLFRHFAVKLVDLWRYESGLPIEELFGRTSGWDYLVEAQAKKHGVLLLTPHLGNWEFGGPWLARRGIPLQVITLPEPGNDFTQLRRESRARWNIDTLVIQNDPFAFLEIIRKLEAGATVALLVDRPPPPTGVEVSLFGKPFLASIAAAELARASGCALLPVYLPQVGSGYEAHILPAIPYLRASLRDREARRQLTQQIMCAFEPVISQHLDQWYHFVPVWKEQAGDGPAGGKP